MHPADAAALHVSDGDLVRLANRRGAVRLHARLSRDLRPGLLVHEGLSGNGDFVDGEGINTLVGADPVAPSGGAAFHDTHVRLEAAPEI